MHDDAGMKVKITLCILDPKNNYVKLQFIRDFPCMENMLRKLDLKVVESLSIVVDHRLKSCNFKISKYV